MEVCRQQWNSFALLRYSMMIPVNNTALDIPISEHNRSMGSSVTLALLLRLND
jgi:hypothetical protein